MEALKFFILDSKAGEALEGMIRNAAEELKYEVRTKLSTEPELPRLPRDYDGYLIHLSNTSEEAVRELREEQPWSKIFGIFGGGISINPEYLDSTYYIIDSGDAKSIVRRTREIYCKD